MSVWVHVKAEVTEGAGLAWQWAARTGGSVLAVSSMLALAAALRATEPLPVLGVGLACAALQSLALGAAAGLLALGWRLAGWAMLAPVLLVPTGVAGACWFGSGMMLDALRPLSVAVARHHHTVGAVGHLLGAPALSPGLVLIFLPFWIVLYAFSLDVLVAALAVYVVAVWVVGAGVLAGAAVSLPIVFGSTISRLVSRARWRASIPDAAMAR